MTRRTALSVASASLCVAWAAWAALRAPAPGMTLPAGSLGPYPVVRGASHVHSRESDGTGSVAEIGAAAARAGLDFVILTDHGDAAGAARPPRYYSGVLCIEGVEVSTDDGHYAVLGLARAPYPLGGEGRDVIEDVTRLGGFGIVAHPDSAKRGLQWREWTAVFQGIEWFNSDSEWRDEDRWRLPPTLIRYLRRPVESVASLFDRPDATLARWDALTQQRRVVGMAGHDAHQRLGLNAGAEPAGQRLYVKVPSYENVFRAFTTSVEVDHPLRADAQSDAAVLLDAIRAGRVYTAIDGVATPARFSFEARVGESHARMGDSVALTGPITLTIRSNAPDRARLVLVRNGQPVETRRGGELDWRGGRPGVYRVEITIPGGPGHPPIPWLVSNPIYIGVDHRSPAAPPAVVAEPWPAVNWRAEKDGSSFVSVSAYGGPDAPGVAMAFTLADVGAASPFVAAVTTEVDRLRPARRVSFRVTADRPMRASVQIRSRSADPDDRWRRSFYADTLPRTVVVPLEALRPVIDSAQGRLTPDRIGTLMFVVDTTNTRRGVTGRLVVDRLQTGQ